MSHNRDRRAFWHAHWQRCRTLGMSLKDYAEQEGLSLMVFYGWSQPYSCKNSLLIGHEIPGIIGSNETFVAVSGSNRR